MAAHLTILLILTGLTVTGVNSVTTVSEVSVKVKGSITIPCLYNSKYRNHVKFLCKGYYWNSCSDQVKTNGRNSTKFSISDDQNQGIFTVTIKDLRDTDTDYWCRVEINGGPDVGQYFHLSVTTGTPGLYVDRQEITGFNGESVSINCTSGNSANEMKWCRLGGNCETISDQRDHVFTVNMSGLTTESSGWYYFAQGKLQMPVHVTVTERPSHIAGTNISPTLESVSESSQDPRTVQPSDQHSSLSILLKSFIIRLSVLTFIIAIVALSIWLMFKRSKRNNKADSPAEETMRPGTAVYRTKDEKITVLPFSHSISTAASV